MSTRTVRLDEDAEETLKRLRNVTGLSISEVLKRGLSAYEVQALQQGARKPYDVYREIEQGTGGHALAPARKAKIAIADLIRRKHKR